MTKARTAPASTAPAADDAPPRKAHVGETPMHICERLLVTDADGAPIDHVLGYDQDAGTLTRRKVVDGNLVREGDRFAEITEDRAFTVAWKADA